MKTSLLGLCLVAGCSSLIAGCVAETGPLDATPSTPRCEPDAQQGCRLADENIGVQSCQAQESGYAWGECKVEACKFGTLIDCVTTSGQPGVAVCKNEKFGRCGVVKECTPTGNVGCESCELNAEDEWVKKFNAAACGTPLVLAFGQQAIEITRASGEFDLFGQNMSIGTDWVSAKTPWLAIDRNANDSIDSGAELFGSMTELPSGSRASNGFVALAPLDDNRDGWITTADSGFSKLLLWRDEDQDRRSSRAELVSAEQAGIQAIQLDYRVVPRCTLTACERERARFIFRSPDGMERSGDVVDVHFAATKIKSQP